MAIKISNWIGVTVAVVCMLYFVRSTDAAPTRTTVEIPEGKLEGKEELSRDGRKFYAFRGIPYGKAERWEDSVSAEKWEGTKDVSEFGASCLQYDIFAKKIYGEEDCLFLNVYSPKITNGTGTGLPVMVYIHGGGFLGGSSSDFGPKYFMDEDVVLVTINYRVGPFGLTDTGFGSNFGLKDQVLALKWINKNIQHFGGDQKSITIFGESAGGVSVSLHMLSPLSKGLFHKGISQSGTPHNPLIYADEKPQEFSKLGRLMGCPSKSTPEELLTCLKKVDGLLIVKTIIGSLVTPGFNIHDIPQVVLKIEKNGENVFLLDYPVNLLKKGQVSKTPWITGANQIEGVVALLLHPGIQAIYKNGADEKYWNAIAPLAFGYDGKNTKRSESIRNFYFGNNDKASFEGNMTNLLSDYTFVHPSKASAVQYAKYAPTYLYHFSKRGVASYFNDVIAPGPDGLRTPAHGDELQYLFNFPTVFPEIQANSKFADFSDKFVKLWVSFAKNGNVEQMNQGSAGGNATAWTPLSNSIGPNDDIQWYDFDTESKMTPESIILESRMKFWDNIDNNTA